MRPPARAEPTSPLSQRDRDGQAEDGAAARRGGRRRNKNRPRQPTPQKGIWAGAAAQSGLGTRFSASSPEDKPTLRSWLVGQGWRDLARGQRWRPHRRHGYRTNRQRRRGPIGYFEKDIFEAGIRMLSKTPVHIVERTANDLLAVFQNEYMRTHFLQ